MITKTKSYSTTDGSIFATVELAQKHELEAFLTDKLQGALATRAEPFANLLIENSDEIINLLTLKASSRPAARKVNRKKSKPVAEPAQTSLA